MIYHNQITTLIRYKSDISWIRFNKKQQDQTCDGISYAVFGAPNLPAFVAQFIMKKVLNPISQNKRDVKNIYSSSHLILFSTTENTLAQWLKLGQHLQRCVLKLTQLDIHHTYLNQPNEVPEIAKQLANRLGMAEKYPTLLLRVGYSKSMPFSKRRDIKNILV